MAETMEDSDVAFAHPLPSHDAKLLECLNRQWMDCNFCDLLLLVQGEQILVHSCVVSAFCPTVAEILLSKSSQNEDIADSVCLKEERKSALPSMEGHRFVDEGRTVVLDFSCEVVQCALSAFYTGVLRPRAEILTELLAAAEWLRARDLVSAIKQHAADPSLECLSLSQTLPETDMLEGTEGKLAESNIHSNISEVNLASEPGISVDDEKNISNLDRQENSLSQLNVDSKFSVVSTKINSTTLESLLSLEGDNSCIVNFEEYGENKELGGISVKRSESAKKVKGRKFKTSSHDSNTTAEVNSSCCKLGNEGTKIGNCDCKSSSKLMVARLKRELTELKQKSHKRKGEKPVSSARKNSRTGGKKERKKRVEDSTGNGCIKNSLIEEMEECDPMKQELDFLVGSSNHVKCRRCHKKFTDLDLYHNHINDHPTFRCEECGMKFMRKLNLTRHIRYNHEGASHLTCKLCPTETDNDGKAKAPFKARTEVEFRRHGREVHGVEHPFSCEHTGCQFRARKYGQLLHHQQIHSAEKLFICDKCGQGFSQHCGLVSHQRACYHLQEYLCDLCGQSFNHPQSMRSHRRVMHFGEKRYKCSVCANSFSDHRNLRRHMRIHDNSFPYACPVCKQKYRHSNSLKAHMATKHPDLSPEQLQVPIPQPRNKLGGSSFKRRSAKRSSTGGDAMFRKEALSQVTSNGVKGGRGRKVKGDEFIAHGNNLAQPQCLEPFQHGEQQQLFKHSGGPGGDWSLQVSDQSGFEAPSSDLDIIMDYQTGRATLQVKSAGSADQRDTLVLSNKGEQNQPMDSLREYAAFLEKQSALYGVYPGAVSGTHQPQAAGGVNPSRTADSGQHHMTSLSSTHPVHTNGFLSPTSLSVSSCNLLTSDISGDAASENPLTSVASNKSTGASSSFRLKHPRASATSFHSSSQDAHHHQSSMISIFGGTNESSVKNLSPPNTSSSAPAFLSFSVGTPAHYQDALSLHVYKNGGVGVGAKIAGEGQSSNCRGLQSPMSWYRQPQEEAANLSKIDGDSTRYQGKIATTSRAAHLDRSSSSTSETGHMVLADSFNFRQSVRTSPSRRENSSPERLRLPQYHQPHPHHHHHYPQHHHHQQHQPQHPGEGSNPTSSVNMAALSPDTFMPMTLSGH